MTKQAVWAYIAEKRIELVVNCAAYTAVDKAEDNSELAYQLNCEAPKQLASAAQFNGAAMIQVSTDYVFDGTGTHSVYGGLRPLSGLRIRHHQTGRRI